VVANRSPQVCADGTVGRGRRSVSIVATCAYPGTRESANRTDKSRSPNHSERHHGRRYSCVCRAGFV